MKKIALLTLLLINLSLSFSLPRNQASPAIFSVTKTNNSILFRHTDSTLTAIPCQSVASIVSNADPSKIVSVWVVQQGDYDKIMQFDYLVCGFSSKSDAVDSLTAWAICDTVGSHVFVSTDSATVTQYNVLNSQNTPPVSPSTGDVYLVGTVPTGAWVGQAKDIAEWNGSAWVFTDGVQGDFLYNATNALTYIFRSGNWVQTTGIPALNNGNTISSGLRIGTNNARSLTFETNNVNRGRFDSIGRFYVYDTSLRKSNKYLQIDSITGRLVASEISGSSGGGTPAGSDTQIQYNNAGAFGADSGFTRDVAGGSTTILNTTDFGGGETIDGGITTTGGITTIEQIYSASAVPLFGARLQIDGTENAVNLTTANNTSGDTNGFYSKGSLTVVGNYFGGGNNTKITIDDVNEQITIGNIKAYDDDAAAGTAGLTAGMVYMTTGSGSAPLNTPGILMIKQ